MENINRKNYNAPGKTGFENSPAKVWHVNELTGNSTGYKTIAGYINYTASNTETITILCNDTEYPDSSVSVSRVNSGAFGRSWLYLTFNFPGNTKTHATIGNINRKDNNVTSTLKLSVSEASTSTFQNIIYEFFSHIVSNTGGLTLNNLGGGPHNNYIYFEFKLFNV